MATLDHAEPPREKGLPRKRHAYRFGIVASAIAVVLALVLTPLAVISVLAVLHRPVTGHDFDLMQPTSLQGEWTKLNVSAVSIDETAQTATLRISGFHDCPAGSCRRERVQFFSVHADPTGALGAPPSDTVDLPSDSSEIEQEITLPIEGNLIDYPFDHYKVLLGVAFSQVGPGGKTVPFSPRSADSGLAYSIDDAIPRVNMARPQLLSASQYDGNGVVYDSVASLELSRPLYLRILNVDLILLIVASAFYGVIFRPFDQIIPTVGALVLGVWGVRSLLVGSYPPDSTGVDLILETAIFMVLLVVGIRSVHYMWPGAQLGAASAGRRGGRGEPGEEEQVEIETEYGGDGGGE